MVREGARDGSVKGASVGAPWYAEMLPVGELELGELFDTYDAEHRREIRVLVGHGAAADRVVAAFDAWREVSTHPNAVTVFNLRVSEPSRTAAMEMELVGYTLADRLRAGSPMDPAEVLTLTHGLSSALTELHAAEVALGDIEPAGVSLTADRRPQLCQPWRAVRSEAADDARADVASLGALLAGCLGAAYSPSVAALVPIEPRDEERLDAAPEELRRLLATAADPGRGMPAEELLRASAVLCRRYLGRVPERLGLGEASTGGRPATAAGGGESTASTALRAQPLAGEEAFSGDSVSVDAEHVGTAAGKGSMSRWAALIGIPAVAFVVAALAVRCTSASEPAARPVGALEDVRIEPPDTVPPSGEPLAPPGAPGEVRARFVSQGSVLLEWTDNSDTEDGYLVRVGTFVVDPSTREVAATPTRELWVHQGGTTEDAAQLRYLPPDTTSVEIEIEDLSQLTCVRPLAVSSAGTTEVEQQLCIPSSPPAAPTIISPQDRSETEADGLRLVWADNSFDEHHFVVLRLDAEGSVQASTSVDADVTSVAPALGRGDAACFVVRAENARNTVVEAIGQDVVDDGANSAPVCVRAR